MQALQFLEQLQLVEQGAGVGWKDQTRDRSAFLRDNWERMFGEYGGEDREAVIQLAEDELSSVQNICSIYEDPGTLMLMAHLKRDVDAALKRLRLGPLNDLVIGTLATGELNALAVKVPSTAGHIVVLNRGLFPLLNLSAKILTQCFRIADHTVHGPQDERVGFALTHSLRDRIRLRFSTPNPRVRFWNLMIMQIMGSAAQAAVNFQDPIRVKFHSMIRDTMELFIFAHEAGHVVGGHLTRSSNERRMVAKSEIQTASRDWNDEFEADRIATQLVIDSERHEQTPLPVVALSLHYLFVLMEYVDRGSNILLMGRDVETESGSHPPSSARRAALRQVLVQLLTKEEMVASLSMMIVLTRIMDSLWSWPRYDLFALRTGMGAKLRRISGIWYRWPYGIFS
jgi:hypothetical protein